MKQSHPRMKILVFMFYSAMFLITCSEVSSREESTTIGKQIIDEVKATSCTDLDKKEIFDRQILPLVHEGEKTSCARCHLPGVDFRPFIQIDECQTFACLSSEDLISVENPLNSKILSWILRGHKVVKLSLADDPVTLAEYKAFTRWISYQTKCNNLICNEVNSNQCEIDKLGIDEPRVDLSNQIILPDLSSIERCSEADTVIRFIEQVWPFHGRCYHCHSDYYSSTSYQVPRPAAWMSDDRGLSGAWETVTRLLDSEYLNYEDPHQSLILLKPLSELDEGVQHGGGHKMIDKTDELYQALLNWTEYIISCD